MWYVYILECESGSLYTGITNNLKRRLYQHVLKTTHFTSYNTPLKMIYTEEFGPRASARRREKQIKRWTQAKKRALANQDYQLLQSLFFPGFHPRDLQMQSN